MREEDYSIQMNVKEFHELLDKLNSLEAECKQKDQKIVELEEKLKSVLNSYKALTDYINSERTTILAPDDLLERAGHYLLGGKQIMVIGACACKPKNLLGYAKSKHGFTNADFRFISEYDKIKNRQVRLRYDKLAGIIIGPVPHYAEGVAGDLLKFIADWQSIVPVMICKSKDGGIKISKQAFADSLVRMISEVRFHC